MVKRKVVCVFGKFDSKSDFVLEPSCPESCKCDICKDAFWIEHSHKTSSRNPAHYCMGDKCKKFLGHRGFCSTKCHDSHHDGYDSK